MKTSILLAIITIGLVSCSASADKFNVSEQQCRKYNSLNCTAVHITNAVTLGDLHKEFGSIIMRLKFGEWLKLNGWGDWANNDTIMKPGVYVFALDGFLPEEAINKGLEFNYASDGCKANVAEGDNNDVLCKYIKPGMEESMYKSPDKFVKSWKNLSVQEFLQENSLNPNSGNSSILRANTFYQMGNQSRSQYIDRMIERIQPK